MTKLNLSTLFALGLVILLLVALIAPFTFLTIEKPAPVTPVAAPKVVKKAPKKVEQPLHNVRLPDFARIVDVKEKKRQFFAFMRPAINAENNKIRAERARVEQLIAELTLEQPLTDEDQQFINGLLKKYKVSKKYSLLRQLYELELKVDVIPPALVLVQAANESAWGTSRFARIGLNFFGVWCYSKGCGMVPSGRNTGAKHEVAAYKSVAEGVARYFQNINTHHAYSVFRAIRRQLREQSQPLAPEILATGLTAYSERGAEYVLELTEMIRHNRQYFKLDKPSAKSL
ncbi:Bax protein [Colwellia chukchiensis]|uniref:Bax protein n=1 Tax=Colwellia chukchiensis TaxID=641665 RepID=A0A1H7QFK9_9GAMM|nr:glucosaminidase domain-containing protein [Colwellia chukchiensis]SEL46891.1 Bax protein [Colwellia chukchiensis]